MDFKSKFNKFKEKWFLLIENNKYIERKEIDEFINEGKKLKDILNNDSQTLNIKYDFYFLISQIYDKVEEYFKESEENISKCVL